MKRALSRLSKTLSASFLLAFVSWNPLRAESTQPVDQVLNKYCVTCHNQRTRSGGLALDTMALAEIPAHDETWEKVVKKLRSGTMPPAGMPRPDLATYRATASWLEEKLDAAEPYAGRPVIHRLNRAEYANSIRDLLDLQVDVSALLPPDDSAFGFDNISEALGVSPALQERHLAAAVKLAALGRGRPFAACFQPKLAYPSGSLTR